MYSIYIYICMYVSYLCLKSETSFTQWQFTRIDLYLLVIIDVNMYSLWVIILIIVLTIVHYIYMYHYYNYYCCDNYYTYYNYYNYYNCYNCYIYYSARSCFYILYSAGGNERPHGEFGAAGPLQLKQKGSHGDGGIGMSEALGSSNTCMCIYNIYI